MDLIDPSTIFRLEIIKMSEAKSKDLSYFMTIDSWDRRGLVLRVNFTNPLKISQGKFNDQVRFHIIDANFFVSAETGEVVELTNGILNPTISIPTQLPQGITEEEVVSAAQSGTYGTTALVVIQLVA